MKVKGKRLDTLVKKYDDIVSGKATAFKVTKKEAQKFHRAGFETTQEKFIIAPHSVTERARLSKGQITIKSKRGIERVQIPIEFQNLKQWLRDVKRNYKPINAMKGKREYFGVRFFGGQRANFYADIRDLIADLERYESVKVFMLKAGYKQEEIYKHLEILRMNSTGTRNVERAVEKRRTKMSQAYNRKHAKKQREKIKRDPEKLQTYRDQAAERAREYRKRRKSNKRAEAHARRMNKERQAKFREKMNRKKKRKRNRRS